MTARALWTVAPGRAELGEAALPAVGPDAARVRTLWTAVSRGTERLVLGGRIASGEFRRMRAPMQEGDFPFPVKYGYCAVGVVEEGPSALAGRTVFALHPHQDRFVAPAAALTPVPAAVPPRRAALAANMETALNAVWDGGAAPGDRIVVVGAGLVGLLVGWLCARLPGSVVTAVDVAPARRTIAERLGVGFAMPAEAPPDADVVFHASASAAGLATAIASAGDEARIVELSWYGDGEVPVALGGPFHSRRLQLVSAQVGQVSPAHRPRWSRARRLAKALDLLADDALEALITEEIRFADLPAAMPRLLAPGAPGLATVVRYD